MRKELAKKLENYFQQDEYIYFDETGEGTEYVIEGVIDLQEIVDVILLHMIKPADEMVESVRNVQHADEIYSEMIRIALDDKG